MVAPDESGREREGAALPAIGTTHTGSLQRPAALTEALFAKERGEPVGGLDELAAEAVVGVVARQAACGIEVLNDGEMGKVGYSTYVVDRLTGFDGEERSTRRRPADAAEFPDFAAAMSRYRTRVRPADPACTGPVTLADPDAVQRDIARLERAAAAAGVEHDRLFLTAASPGLISHFLDNRHYPTRAEYLGALAEAMRHEYRAIVDAGLTLQLDCPDLAGSYNTVFQHLSVEEFRREVDLAIDAINTAVAGLPPERLRIHVCWGNQESPHTHDVPLRDIFDRLLRANVAGLSIEAANPRHGHEWQLFEELDFPDDRYLIPGVIDTTTNFVEHPELVAQRLDNYVRLLGAERVVAGCDCGFGTFVGRDVVVEDVTWAKLASMVEGARLASAAAARRGARHRRGGGAAAN